MSPNFDADAEGPFHPKGLVIEADLTSPTTYLRFSPERYERGAWLHDPEEFDHSIEIEAVVERYALPEADEYEVAIVEVPPGESIQIGSPATRTDEYGRGDLIRIEDRDEVPEAWIQETTTLRAYIESGPPESSGDGSDSGGLLDKVLGIFS